MSVRFDLVHPGAERLAALTLAEAIRPRPPVRFRDWLPQNIVLVDGPRKGEPWALADAPYLAEIADCLDPEHPCNLVSVRKSQQTGVSILGLSWCLFLSETSPDNIIYGLPSIDFLQDMNSQKLSPLIEAWQKRTGKQIMSPATSRSGAGSTIYEKRFAGGSLMLANANVATDLSGKTTRFGVKDEVSKWQNHTNGDDPEALFFGRFTAFRRTKNFKILELSTPEFDTGDELGEAEGHCRIDRSFRRSDKRFWNITCLECGATFKQTYEGFHIDREHPHQSFYGCPACGHVITESERVVGVRQGRFVATETGPDRHPGFHVDAFDSLMMSYEAIAEDVIAYSKSGGHGEKAIYNLVLGLPAAEKVDAPDHARLMQRVDPHLTRGHIPPLGLILVGAADVQMAGIWYVIKAYGPDRQSWRVDAGYIAGATDDPFSGAFAELEELRTKRWPDAFGSTRTVDLFGIDAGYRSHVVYTWVRGKAATFALKGDDGWQRPPLGQPSPVDIDFNGRRIRRGAMVWGVGTWSLKAAFYTDLAKQATTDGGTLIFPQGYCHFGSWMDEVYFRQITSEYLATETYRGRARNIWKPRSGYENHLLDCEVYGSALADYLGVSRMTEIEWRELAGRRGVPDTVKMPDLFAPAPVQVQQHSGTESRANLDPSDGDFADSWWD